jgi:hypothetical protein
MFLMKEHNKKNMEKWWMRREIFKNFAIYLAFKLSSQMK